MTWGASDLAVRIGPTVALDGVSLDIPDGQITGVIGGDGAGKSTLLRVLAGGLRPDTGTVRRPDRRRIGYLPAGSGVYDDLSVDENLQFSGTVYGLSSRDIRAWSAPLLERTGLAAARSRLARHLSGGMRQKLGVVRAMLHRPEMLVLDEPTTGVDPVSRADLWWLMASYVADGTAMLVSTTYVQEAQRCASVVLLSEGRVLASGPAPLIVSAIPGQIHTAASKPVGGDAARAWRRGAEWRVWRPTSTGPVPAVEAVGPDLQDAVTVAELRAEIDRGGTRTGGC
jgi:ABC-2 type transport system ATP-binding protein